MALTAVWVPIVLFIVLGFAAVMITKYVTAYKRSRLEIEQGGSGTQYQALAHEVVESQRLVVEEVRKMNETLKEIERLFRGV